LNDINYTLHKDILIYIKIMISNDIINLLKNDDNVFFDYYNKLTVYEKKSIICYIFKYNLKNIALNIIKNDCMSMSVIIYDILIKQYLKEKNKMILLFILNSLIYINNKYYSDLIYKFAKNDLWEIVDYLHMMGYITLNEKIIEIYPKNKTDELYKYGYILKNDGVFITKYKKDNATITKLCKTQNINILQKLIDIKRIKLSISDIFTLCQINIRKTKKKLSKWGRRRLLFDNYCKIINKTLSDDIINFIKKNKNNIILKKNKLFTTFCIKNTIYELFDKKMHIFNNLMMNKIYFYFYTNDDVDGFKYMIKQNIIKPIDIYKNKFINVNDTIIDNKPKMFEYFTKELKMSYTCHIFYKYYHNKHNIMTHIKELEKLGLKNDDSKLLNLTVQIGSIALYNYVDKTKLKFKSKHVIIALVHNNFKLAKLLIKNGCKINKQKMLSQIIYVTNHIGCYFRSVNYDKIIKDYDCHINEENLLKIINILSYTTINHLYNKNKTLFNNVDIEAFAYYLLSGSKIYNELEEVYNYILHVQTKHNDKHKLEICEKILLNSIDICINHDIIEKFIENHDYKLTYDFCKRINFISDMYIFKFVKLMEKHNVNIDDNMIYHIFIYFFNEECAEYLINKYDFKGSIKLLNNMVSVGLKYDVNLNFIKFLVDKMNITPTPYTTEILIMQYNHYGYDNKDVLLYMINKTGLTNKAFENLNKLKYIKNFNKKYNIIEYQPLDEEIIEVEQVYDNISEPDDELEQAIQDGIKLF